MSEELLEMRGIEVECFGVDIGKDRGGTDVVDHPCSGEEGEAGDDHLVARTNLQGSEGEEKGIGATCHANRVFHSAVSGNLFLKCLYLRAEDESTGSENFSHSSVDFRLYRLVLSREIQYRNAHRV